MLPASLFNQEKKRADEESLLLSGIGTSSGSLAKKDIAEVRMEKSFLSSSSYLALVF